MSGCDTELLCMGCGGHQVVSFGDCLRTGWPSCCEQTMTLVETTADIVACVDDLVQLDRCLMCGCSDEEACPGGCFWVAPGLCSACAVMPVRAMQI
jgi:hypothetical protein